MSTFYIIIFIITSNFFITSFRYARNDFIFQNMYLLTLLHSDWPKLYGVLANLSAIGTHFTVKMFWTRCCYKEGPLHRFLLLIKPLSEWFNEDKEHICQYGTTNILFLGKIHVVLFFIRTTN